MALLLSGGLGCRSVFIEQRTHLESYEIVRAGKEAAVRFAAFLRDLAETYRLVERVRPHGAMHYLAVPHASVAIDPGGEDGAAAAEIADRLAAALRQMGEAERVAVQLFIVEGMAPRMWRARSNGRTRRPSTTGCTAPSSDCAPPLERDGIGPADL